MRSTTRIVFVLLALSVVAEAQVTEPVVVRNPQVSAPVVPTVFNGDLRDLPVVRGPRPGDPAIEIPRRQYPRPGQDRATAPRAPGPDPLLDRQLAALPALDRAFTTPTDFAGQGFSGVNPPDTVGDVGPTFYIQMINGPGGSLVVIYNKNGTVAVGPFELDSLGTGSCASGLGDPIVLYDRLAGRWMLSEFSDSGNNLCVYVSQTGDPISGGWFNYQFQAPDFPDYPKYAVWPDAYYIATNESLPAVYALDRGQMLAGGVATFQRFTAAALAGFPFQALTPSDIDGASIPPVGSPGYFIRHRDDEVHNVGSNNATQDFLEIWEFDVDFAAPGNSTFTGPTNIAVAEFDSDLCGLSSFDCFPQPGTATRLDPLREVVMWRSQYRNFGTHETIVGNFVTDVDGADRGGIRWFELRRTGGAWSLFQEGTYSPDTTNRWMGSIAMDVSGNIALGYSAGSSTVFPGIRYTGRLAGDPAGAMPQVETTVVIALGSNGSNRWGDYSSMNVDPVDDCTFWYTNEYATTAGTWNTRIASFRFTSCGSTLAVTSIVPTSGRVAGGTKVTITGTSFVNGATATIGGVAATAVTWVNPTTITATTAAHAVGPVDVVVTNPNTQTGMLTNGFVYAVPSLTQFTDDPLVAGTFIKAVHFDELRNGINGQLARYGQPGHAYSNVVIAGATVQALDLTEMFVALNKALQPAGEPILTIPTITPEVTVVIVLHINALRAALLTVEAL